MGRERGHFLGFCSVQKYHGDRREQRYHRSYQEHVRRVVIYRIAVHVERARRFAELLDYRRKGGPYDHRDQHPEYHPYALKHARFVGRGQIPHGSREICGNAKVRAHQHKARRAYRRHRSLTFETEGTCEQHSYSAYKVYAEQGKIEFSAVLHFRHEDPENDRGGRGRHYYHGDGQNIATVRVFKRSFGVHYQVRHKTVVRDSHYTHGGIGEIEVFIGFYDLFAEAVDYVAVIGRGIWSKRGIVAYGEYPDNAYDGYDRAEQHIKQRPVARGYLCAARYPARHFLSRGGKISVLGHPVHTAEYRSHSEYRHYRYHAFDHAAFGPGGIVGHPRVKGGVVCGRTHIRHHAVHYHYRHYGGYRGGGNALYAECREVIHGYKRKQHYDETPDNVTEADETAAVAFSVRPYPPDERRRRGGDSACRDHYGNGYRAEAVVAERHRTVDKYVEIHIFDYPRDLSEKSENDKGSPKFCAEFCAEFCAVRSCFFHKTPPVYFSIERARRAVNTRARANCAGRGGTNLCKCLFRVDFALPH